MHNPLSLRCPVCSAEPGNWSELQQHLAKHLCDVFKNDGLRDAFLGQAQAGGGSARAGPSSGENRRWQKGYSDRYVTRRLVDVLATLSVVNAAELRELTATVFKTCLVPCSESVAEAMAEAGRLYHESAGAVKSKPEAEARRRSRAARSPVRARVGGVPAKSGGNEGAGARTCSGVEVVLGEQRGEERAGAAGGARSALLSEACKKIEGKEGWTRIVFCLPTQSLSSSRVEVALQLQKGVRKHGPAPRGPLEREASRLPTQMRGSRAFGTEWNNTVNALLSSCVVECWSHRWCMLSK